MVRSGLTFDVRLTDGPGAAAELARQAVLDGVGLIVAVGGDGTLHEIVNGMLTEAEGRRADGGGPMLGLVPAGRGSDYARGLGLPVDPEAQVDRFAAAISGDPGALRSMDVGLVEYRPSVHVAGRPASFPAPAASSRAGVMEPDPPSSSVGS